MGKTEKIVVLSILFLVVVLFVWSLGGGEGTAAKGKGTQAEGQTASYSSGQNSSTRQSADRRQENSGAPGAPKKPANDGRILTRPKDVPALEGTREGLDAQTAGARERIALENGTTSAENKVLFAGVEKRSRRASAPVQMRPGWAIVSTSGLESTVDPSMLLFRPKATDTWASLAMDLYGEASKEALLRHNNEGMDSPGEVIFVPARDDDADLIGTRVVKVLQGENLWQVSHRTLGKGSRWKEIFEANRDVISDPDFIAPGIELSIPMN